MKLALPLKPQKAFALTVGDILSALNCLNYLTQQEADDAARVREYSTIAQERLYALRDAMSPLLWNPSARPL
jgi:hypothetical protein